MSKDFLIERNGKKYEVVIVADYGHGIITNKIANNNLNDLGLFIDDSFSEADAKTYEAES